MGFRPRPMIWMLATFAVLGCDPESPEQCVCTLNRESVRFLVIYPQGAPVPGVTVSVQLVRTGEVLDVLQPAIHAGVITVVDDSFKPLLACTGDTLRVVGAKDKQNFAVDFIVGCDAPCECHVTKLAGPNFVILQPPNKPLQLPVAARNG